MIFIVEIPHQRPPSAWSATNITDAVDTLDGLCVRENEECPYPADSSDAICWYCDDLSSVKILEDNAALKDFFNSYGHQILSAQGELRRVIADEVYVCGNGFLKTYKEG
jgi:hypothetical protein